MTEMKKTAFGGALLTGIFLGLLGAFSLVMLEGGYFLLSGKRLLFGSPGEYGLFLVYLTGLLLPLGAVIGIWEGIFSWIVFRLFPGRRRILPGASLIAAVYVLGLYCYVIFRNAVLANLDHPTESHLYRQIFVLASLVCLLSFLPLCALQNQRRRLAEDRKFMRGGSAAGRIGRIIAAITFLIVLYWADASFFHRVYPYLNNMVSLVLFWLGQYLILCLLTELSLLHPRLQPKALLLFGAPFIIATLTFTLCRFGDNQKVKRIVLLETPFQGKAIQWIHRLADFDRDGYSAILGGGDCDDRNPAVNPGAYDIPGDEIDQDCFGGPRMPQSGREILRGGPVPEIANVIFITIDAVRYDHVGCYDHHRRTTPHLDRLAAGAARFVEVYSQSTNTIFSFNSVMTSLIPLEAEQLDIAQTLPETLKQAGWTTVVIAPRIRFEAYDFRHLFYRGFDRQEFPVVPPPITDQATTRKLTEKALEFLRREHERPFFLWLHYYDPHAPYLPNPGSPNWGGEAIDLYDGEILRTDTGIGEILDCLRETGLFDRSLIAVFADHGEEFGDHGGRSHGPTLYQEVLRVPLIIRIPGAAAQTVTTRASLIDLAPTVLDAVGLPFPRRTQGISLLPAILGLETRERDEGIFAENLLARKRTILYGNWKLIYDYRRVNFELYNLADDPDEERDIFDREPDRAADLIRRLAAYY